MFNIKIIFRIKLHLVFIQFLCSCSVSDKCFVVRIHIIRMQSKIGISYEIPVHSSRHKTYRYSGYSSNISIRESHTVNVHRFGTISTHYSVNLRKPEKTTLSRVKTVLLCISQSLPMHFAHVRFMRIHAHYMNIGIETFLFCFHLKPFCLVLISNSGMESGTMPGHNSIAQC